MAYAGGVAFLLLSFYVTADVLGRKFLHVSSAATDEIGGYVLAFGGMWALAWTLRTGGHVRIDVLLPHLAPAVQALLGHAAIATMAFVAGFIARYSWSLAIDSWVTGARAMSFMQTPLFVPQGLLALGLSVLALEALVILACGLAASLAAGRLAPPPLLESGGEAVVPVPGERWEP
jgi:TRAP-type C4-dicarboxylate transport system permease small subunit